MELYDIFEEAVKSKYRSVFIYGEDHDKGIKVLMSIIKANFNSKRVRFLTNAMKNIKNFELGIENCNSYTTYQYGTNFLHFDNIQHYRGTEQDDIVIVYPADELLLDSLYKNSHKLIDKILYANSEKIIFLTEYEVNESDLDYLVSKVDKSIKIIDEE